MGDQGRSSVRIIWDRYGADLLTAGALVLALLVFGIAVGGLDDVLIHILAVWPLSD